METSRAQGCLTWASRPVVCLFIQGTQAQELHTLVWLNRFSDCSTTKWQPPLPRRILHSLGDKIPHV